MSRLSLSACLAAQTQLLEYGNTEDRKIGYLARGTDAINRINLNAFAIGVAMADPECKISLKAAGRDEDYRQQFAANYWFGLATGVVDIRVPDINKQTLKMLDFFKDAVISGTDPFSGKLKDNEGNERTFTGKITPGDVLTIDWLNENIEGSL